MKTNYGGRRYELPPLFKRTNGAWNKRKREEENTGDHEDDGYGDDQETQHNYTDADYTWTLPNYPEPRSTLPKHWNANATPLRAMLLDVTAFKRKPSEHGRWAVEPCPTGMVHAMRMLALTETGMVVAIDVHGYSPYLYCRPPPGFRGTMPEIERIQSEMEAAIREERAKKEANSRYKKPHWSRDHIASIKSIELQHNLKDLRTFYPPESVPRANEEEVGPDGEDMLFVHLHLEEDLRLLRNRIHCVDYSARPTGQPLVAGIPPVTFESDLDLSMRFISDIDLVGCGWFELPAGTYTIERGVPTSALVKALDTVDVDDPNATGFTHNRSLARTNAAVRWEDIMALPEKQDYPPMRVLSFDLETLSLDPIIREDEPTPFGICELDESPEDERPPEEDNQNDVNYWWDDDDKEDDTAAAGDPTGGKGRPAKRMVTDTNQRQAGIIQISAYLTEFPSGRVLHRALFTLGSCDAKKVGEGVQVFCFGDDPSSSRFDRFLEESRMLREWTRYVALADPDMVTGYNISGFDLNYLIKRYEALKMPCFLGRTGAVTRIYERTLQTKAAGTRRSQNPTWFGRIVLDARPLVEKYGHRLRDYKLNTVAANYLDGVQKEVRCFSSSASPLPLSSSARAAARAVCVPWPMGGWPANLTRRSLFLSCHRRRRGPMFGILGSATG